MSKRKAAIALFCMLAGLAPVQVVASEVEVELVGTTSQAVTISIHNPTAVWQVVRVAVTVRYTDDTTQTLVTEEVVVPAGQSLTTSVSGSQPIAGVIDDPEPINPL